MSGRRKSRTFVSVVSPIQWMFSSDRNSFMSFMAQNPDARRCKGRCGLPLWPGAIWQLGLALSVILWGLDYKLSLCHQNTSRASRTSVAKLWPGPRGPSPKTGCGPGFRAHTIFNGTALASSGQLRTHSHSRFSPYSSRANETRTFVNSAPSRGPPFRFHVAAPTSRFRATTRRC